VRRRCRRRCLYPYTIGVDVGVSTTALTHLVGFIAVALLLLLPPPVCGAAAAGAAACGGWRRQRQRWLLLFFIHCHTVFSSLSVLSISNQSVTMRMGGEVLLDARGTYDPDVGDTLGPTGDSSSLHFYWCLLSFREANGSLTFTTTEDVQPLLRVPQHVGAVHSLSAAMNLSCILPPPQLTRADGV
jgi:hypothetical protein